MCWVNFWLRLMITSRGCKCAAFGGPSPQEAYHPALSLGQYALVIAYLTEILHVFPDVHVLCNMYKNIHHKQFCEWLFHNNEQIMEFEFGSYSAHTQHSYCRIKFYEDFGSCLIGIFCPLCAINMPTSRPSWTIYVNELCCILLIRTSNMRNILPRGKILV